MAENSRNNRGLQPLCQRQLLEPFTRFSTTHQQTIANKSLEESSIFRSQYHIKPAHNTEEALNLINAYFE